MLCLIVFEGQIPHFCKFCRAMVCLGVTCSFFSIFSCNILLLFVLRAFYIGNFDCGNCFRGVTEEFLDFFLLGFVFAFFAVKTSVLHRFALDRFGLFVGVFTFACNHASGMLISQPCASIDCPNLPILSSLNNFSQAQS